MASKNQTPAPKVSSESKQHIKGQRKELAIEHLETGQQQGVTRENVDAVEDMKTTSQKQEEREKRLKDGHESLDIPSGNEGEGKIK